MWEWFVQYWNTIEMEWKYFLSNMLSVILICGFCYRTDALNWFDYTSNYKSTEKRKFSIVHYTTPVSGH